MLYDLGFASVAFVKHSKDSIGLACKAYGHPHQHHYLCLLWNGSHYDALTLHPSDLEAFTS